MCCSHERYENGRPKAKDRQMLRKIFMQSAFINEEEASSTAINSYK